MKAPETTVELCAEEAANVTTKFYICVAMYLWTDDVTEDTESRILSLLQDGPATPDEVASKLGVAWSTARGYLLKLAGEGKVEASRKGRVNVYFLKTPRKATLRVPAWVRVRSLRELATELEAYFPANLSAADMVERERRKA